MRVFPLALGTNKAFPGSTFEVASFNFLMPKPLKTHQKTAGSWGLAFAVLHFANLALLPGLVSGKEGEGFGSDEKENEPKLILILCINSRTCNFQRVIDDISRSFDDRFLNLQKCIEASARAKSWATSYR